MILEIGPGIGVHALPIAPKLLPYGVLDVLDVQQEMLDELSARAERAGVTNIVPTLGDVQELPYPSHRFDAAYLVGVLGEIPNPSAALRQIRRVLKPSGRLIVSEVFIDPDFIPLAGLIRSANEAGFVFDHSAGPAFANSALFRPKTI
jgi:ubiquinone/menaquinone biosynthesis C-methylase UbiE